MSAAEHPALPGFRGDCAWVHNEESHAGKPYWPGGRSGVTLDPGLDLGHASPDLVERFVRPICTPEQWQAVLKVLGLKGAKAKAERLASPTLRSIRTSKEWACEVFPWIASWYWTTIQRRFPALDYAPQTVHTVMLSIAYNRGPGNKDLAVLDAPMARHDWRAVAECIQEMQQDHELSNIRGRRRREGELILAEVG